MRNLFTGFCALLASISTHAATHSEDPLAAAARALGADEIRSITFEASGTYYQFSQAPGPDQPWPAFAVSNYVATVDFERKSVHSRYTRTQKPDGRARPAANAQHLDQYFAEGLTWNVTPDGTALSIPANLAERAAEIWTTPQGFVRAARAQSARVGHAADGSRIASISIGSFRYEGTINSAGEVTQVKSWMDSPVLGDTPIEWRFSQYRDFGGIKFPARIERIAAGLPWYELDVTGVRANTATPISIPDAVARNPEPSVSQVNVETLAPGIFYLTGGSHHSVAIEQSKRIVIVEAPLSEERSLAVIAKVRELIPTKPITHVINTHVHFDHAGGLRTYAHEGALIVTAAPNAPYFERAWQAPRTLAADLLSQSRRTPRIHGYTDSFTIDDTDRPVEVHEIRGNGHADAFSMIYLPAQQLLIEADAWTPAPVQGTPNPYWVNLHENIERLKLDVQRIAPLHGTIQTIAELRRVIGK